MFTTQAPIIAAFLFGLASGLPADAKCDHTRNACIQNKYVTFPIKGGIANITTNLEVNVKTSSSTILRMTNGIENTDASAKPVLQGNKASWTLSEDNCTVLASTKNGRLVITLTQPNGSNVTWPITGGGVDTKYTHLQYPRGPGRNIPLRDEFWNSGTNEGRAGTGTGGDLVASNEAEDVAANFLMPFWGYSAGEGLGAAFILPEDIKTSVKHGSVDGGLQMQMTHDFSKREETTDYTVLFEVTDGSPIASALSYRKYLQEINDFRTLKDKIAKLPANKDLLGAFHTYGFGESGLGVKAMKKVAAAGIKRLWVGYDGDPMNPEAVKQAQSQGYLVGPYDTYANGQPSGKSDTPLGVWPGTAYPDQCITLYNGKTKPGFNQRGCYMSSQAQALSEPTSGNLAQRLKNSTANGVKSYFLDVDAAGELFSDFSESHSQNMKTDRSNRLKRMQKIAKEFVLGSEDSHGWANTAVSYGHGSLSMVDSRFFVSFMNITSIWGGYKPDNGPDTFFKPLTLPENFYKTMFDTNYMIPLSEAVLHDSVVNVDRWDLPLYKFPALSKQRILQTMLYNSPMLFAMNGTTIDEKGEELAKYQNFFQPLHEVGGLLPLTDFEYVTEDKSVQRTIFGKKELTMTANFGKKKDVSTGVGPKCVMANLKGKKSTLCV